MKICHVVMALPFRIIQSHCLGIDHYFFGGGRGGGQFPKKPIPAQQNLLKKSSKGSHGEKN